MRKATYITPRTVRSRQKVTLPYDTLVTGDLLS
jgi:hypothetical protein